MAEFDGAYIPRHRAFVLQFNRKSFVRTLNEPGVSRLLRMLDAAATTGNDDLLLLPAAVFLAPKLANGYPVNAVSAATKSTTTKDLPQIATNDAWLTTAFAVGKNIARDVHFLPEYLKDDGHAHRLFESVRSHYEYFAKNVLRDEAGKSWMLRQIEGIESPFRPPRGDDDDDDESSSSSSPVHVILCTFGWAIDMIWDDLRITASQDREYETDYQLPLKDVEIECLIPLADYRVVESAGNPKQIIPVKDCGSDEAFLDPVVERQLRTELKYSLRNDAAVTARNDPQFLQTWNERPVLEIMKAAADMLRLHPLVDTACCSEAARKAAKVMKNLTGETESITASRQRDVADIILGVQLGLAKGPKRATAVYNSPYMNANLSAADEEDLAQLKRIAIQSYRSPFRLPPTGYFWKQAFTARTGTTYTSVHSGYDVAKDYEQDCAEPLYGFIAAAGGSFSRTAALLFNTGIHEYAVLAEKTGGTTTTTACVVCRHSDCCAALTGGGAPPQPARTNRASNSTRYVKPLLYFNSRGSYPFNTVLGPAGLLEDERNLYRMRQNQTSGGGALAEAVDEDADETSSESYSKAIEGYTELLKRDTYTLVLETRDRLERELAQIEEETKTTDDAQTAANRIVSLMLPAARQFQREWQRTQQKVSQSFQSWMQASRFSSRTVPKDTPLTAVLWANLTTMDRFLDGPFFACLAMKSLLVALDMVHFHERAGQIAEYDNPLKIVNDKKDILTNNVDMSFRTTWGQKTKNVVHSGFPRYGGCPGKDDEEDRHRIARDHQHEQEPTYHVRRWVSAACARLKTKLTYIADTATVVGGELDDNNKKTDTKKFKRNEYLHKFLDSSIIGRSSYSSNANDVATGDFVPYFAKALFRECVPADIFRSKELNKLCAYIVTSMCNVDMKKAFHSAERFPMKGTYVPSRFPVNDLYVSNAKYTPAAFLALVTDHVLVSKLHCRPANNNGIWNTIGGYKHYQHVFSKEVFQTVDKLEEAIAEPGMPRVNAPRMLRHCDDLRFTMHMPCHILAPTLVHTFKKQGGASECHKLAIAPITSREENLAFAHEKLVDCNGVNYKPKLKVMAIPCLSTGAQGPNYDGRYGNDSERNKEMLNDGDEIPSHIEILFDSCGVDAKIVKDYTSKASLAIEALSDCYFAYKYAVSGLYNSKANLVGQRRAIKKWIFAGIRPDEPVIQFFPQTQLEAIEGFLKFGDKLSAYDKGTFDEVAECINATLSNGSSSSAMGGGGQTVSDMVMKAFCMLPGGGEEEDDEEEEESHLVAPSAAAEEEERLLVEKAEEEARVAREAAIIAALRDEEEEEERPKKRKKKSTDPEKRRKKKQKTTAEIE